jgi:hypothetical protein
MCFIKSIKYFKICYSFFLLALLTAACSDHGIEPKPILKSPPGFSGTVRFISEWPDSVRISELRKVFTSVEDIIL